MNFFRIPETLKARGAQNEGVRQEAVSAEVEKQKGASKESRGRSQIRFGGTRRWPVGISRTKSMGETNGVIMGEGTIPAVELKKSNDPDRKDFAR